MTTGRSSSGRGRKSLWLVPAIAVLTTAALTVLAIVLDTGDARSRDLALLVGALTFYVVAPITVICVIVATVVKIRRARRVR
jgi:hypothetical protein